MNARDRLSKILALAACAGCLAGPAVAANGAAAEPGQRGPAGLHFAGKPHAAVGASFRTAGAAAVGVPMDVSVTIVAGESAQSVLVAFSAGEGLAVVSPTGTQQFAVERGKPIETTVRVVPQSGGSLRLTALLTVVSGAERQARPVSYALHVKGPVTVVAAKPARTELDADGRRLEPMPAVTTLPPQM